MTTISLDELNSSTTDSNDSETTSDNSGSADVLDRIGADAERVDAYVDEHGNRDGILDFARELEGNDALQSLLEDYRTLNDQKRIDMGYLRDVEGASDHSWSQWRQAHYNGEAGHNEIAEAVRDGPGNLMFYKCLFPEPVEEFVGEPCEVWQEFDDLGYGDDQQDTHIWVEQSFVEEYADFTLEVNGEERVRPPTDSELGVDSSSGGSDAGSSGDLPFDPAEFTNDDLADELDAVEYTHDQLDAALQAELSGKDRKGAKTHLRNAMDDAPQEVDDADGGADAEGGADTSDVQELLDKGFTREQIVEMLS